MYSQELLSEAAALDAELSEAILNVTFILNDTLESLRLANDSLQVRSCTLIRVCLSRKRDGGYLVE